MPTRGLTTDLIKRESLKERLAFNRVRRADRLYAMQLRKVAAHVDDLVRGMHPFTPPAVVELQNLLERYSQILRPWAATAGRRMLVDVSRRDERAWKQVASAMGVTLRDELKNAPIGTALRRLLEEQVTLITSLPLDASRRVHRIVTGNLYRGARADEVAKEILRTGHVTRSRANLIARTETGRAQTALTLVRAEAIGSEGYIWRTARDGNVRPLHRKLEGTFHRWDDPPIAGEKGERAHPGSIFNCRCFAEPQIPQDLLT